MTSDTLTLRSAGGETPVGDHPQVQALLQPNPIHHTDDLENQHVLTQITSRLNRAFHSRALEDHFTTQEILFFFKQFSIVFEGSSLPTLQMMPTFRARGSEQIKEIPKGAALEL